jgi:thiosulfate dehydrogenase [quinone] large subunit
METKRLETSIFGKSATFEYSEPWIGYSVLGLRLVMAWVFLQSGIAKAFDPEWTSLGFLRFGVPEGNPFPGLWGSFAELAWMVDPLVVWGQLFIGIALLLGFFFRFAALMGSLQMLFFWSASLEGGLLAGLPVAHGYFVSYHIVYVILLFGLGAIGAGRLLGIDSKLEETNFVRNNPWVKFFLG